MPKRNFTRRKYLNGTIKEIILNTIEVQPNGCWWWLGGIMNGYAVLPKEGGGYTRVHRESYKEFVGPIPDDKPQIDHKCHKPAECPGGKACLHRRCVNPDHLEPATNAENCSPERGRTGLATGAKQSAKTHCPSGHPYDLENTGWTQNGRERYCKACNKIHRQNYAAKKPKFVKGLRTHCPQGHEYTEENTFYVDRGKYKKCRICKNAWGTRKRQQLATAPHFAVY